MVVTLIRLLLLMIILVVIDQLIIEVVLTVMRIDIHAFSYHM